MEHIRIHLIDLPYSVHAFTIMENIDSYDIYINARMSSEMQISAYDHEVLHINNRDFDMMYDVEDIESLRHAV